MSNGPCPFHRCNRCGATLESTDDIYAGICGSCVDDVRLEAAAEAEAAAEQAAAEREIEEMERWDR